MKECPIHAEPLQPEAVPIRYGLFRIPDGYLEAKESRFPLASTFVMGGCVVGEEKERVRPYCVSCRRALAMWCREHDCAFALPRDVEGFLKKYGGE